MKMSMICHFKALWRISSSYLKEKDDFSSSFLLRSWSKKFSEQHLQHLKSITSPIFPASLRSIGVMSVKLSLNGIYQSLRGRDVEKLPILDLQYPGKLTSLCLPSTADIWQESLKTHYWQRDKAGEKSAPQIILKSQETSSSAYICLTGV